MSGDGQGRVVRATKHQVGCPMMVVFPFSERVSNSETVCFVQKYRRMHTVGSPLINGLATPYSGFNPATAAGRPQVRGHPIGRGGIKVFGLSTMQSGNELVRFS